MATLQILDEDGETPEAPARGLHLFTPNVFPGARAVLWLDDVDHAQFAALPRGESTERVAVYDHDSGLSLYVRRADCGAGCFCAAEIVGLM